MIHKYREKIKEALINAPALIIGENTYYCARYLDEKLLVSFTQPDLEELKEVFKRKETIIYL